VIEKTSISKENWEEYREKIDKLWSEKDFVEAISESFYFIKKSKEIFGEEHIKYAMSLLSLAERFKDLCAFRDSIYYYEKSFPILELDSSIDESWVGSLYMVVGDNYFRLKEYEKCNEAYFIANELIDPSGVTGKLISQRISALNELLTKRKG